MKGVFVDLQQQQQQHCGTRRYQNQNQSYISVALERSPMCLTHDMSVISQFTVNTAETITWMLDGNCCVLLSLSVTSSRVVSPIYLSQIRVELTNQRGQNCLLVSSKHRWRRK